MSIRPRRSVLYMPGSNQRALEKARTLPADALVLDLEDSVGPEKKVEARNTVLEAVKAGGYGARELVVRVNGLASEWGRDDVLALAASGVDAICLPKVEEAAEVAATLQLMDGVGAESSVAVWVMIETPRGVMNIDAIVASDERMRVVVMGTTDLAKELRVPHTPERIGLQFSLGQCVLAARARQRDILDGVYLDLQDAGGYRRCCEQGRDMGFDGKTLIHPNQIAAANEVFGPSPADIERAHKMIAAWREAEAEGKGVVVVDGKLVEAMHIDEAQRHLAIAQYIDSLGGG